MVNLGAAHENLDQKAYSILKKMIIDRKLLPGDKIPQEKLARELGISRTPLVSAIKYLEHEKLVEAKPRRGYFVRFFSIQEMVSIFELREVLEGLAARGTLTSKNGIILNPVIQLEWTVSVVIFVGENNGSSKHNVVLANGVAVDVVETVPSLETVICGLVTSPSNTHGLDMELVPSIMWSASLQISPVSFFCLCFLRLMQHVFQFETQDGYVGILVSRKKWAVEMNDVSQAQRHS